MNGRRDDIKLKLAWQTAYELRTCPDGGTLHAPVPDDNLKRHMKICHVCRDKREMGQDELNSWKALREKFAALAMKPGSGTKKQAGQVWTIKREFGDWRDDGRFSRPPCVLLLEKVEGSSGWRVAQLYSDKRLMGSGDVELDDCHGFAEAWNCYSMKDDRLDVCLGGVRPEELTQVIAASDRVHEPAPEGSILSFFRRMEVEVGAFVAVPAVVELVEEWEAAAIGEVLERREIIKGFFLTVKEAGEVVLTIMHEALANIKEAVFWGSPEALELARSTEIQIGKPPKPESTEAVNIIKEQQIQFIPIDIYTADDNLYISIYKTIYMETPPEFIVTYNSSVIDSRRIVLECWDTDRPTIVIRDLWISKSKLQQAGRLLAIAFKDGEAIIDIMPD
jgi:hypothetical protein